MSNPLRSLAIFLLGTALSLLLCGCVGQQAKHVRDGREYGVTGGSFSGRWWNYYERGRSFADGKYYKEAMADFKEAINGREKDQWRARTYGMHFIDYFPHRELGVVHFQRQEYDLAIAELEDSVESAPSAKGHYFLNKARGAKIKRYGLDQSAPKLILEKSSSKEVTNSFTKVVNGVASDDNFISAITVGGRPVHIELARSQQVFSIEVPLAEGENSIRVTATDIVGKTTEESLEIYCDRRGPQIEIEKLVAEQDQVTISGNVSDEDGLAWLKINGRNWPVSGYAPGYNFTMTLPEGKITVMARDMAGNTTRAVVREEEPDLRQAADYPPLANLDLFAATATGAAQALSDAATPLLAAVPDTAADTDPPYISFEDLGPAEETYEDMILLEGKVSDSSLLVYITVNGEPVLNRKGKRIYFSLLKKLEVGDNEFRIVAADEYGNKMDKRIKITRKVHNIRQIGARMSVAVLPFDQQGESAALPGMVHDQMIDAFIEQGRFNIVERNKIDAVLRELQLSSTDLVDPDQAVELGKLVAAQTLLAGTVIEGPDSIEIIGRFIDTETATILASNDIFGEDKGLAALDSLLDSLAFKFKRDFPLVEGMVIEVRNGEILIDVGKNGQIKPYTKLICYREGPPVRHPVTGRLLGSEPQILGELKVEEIYEDFSKAAVLDKQRDFISSDRVISQ